MVSLRAVGLKFDQAPKTFRPQQITLPQPRYAQGKDVRLLGPQ